MERLLRQAEADDATALDVVDRAVTFAEELRWYGWSSSVLPPDSGDQLPHDIDHTVRPGLVAVVGQISALFPGKCARPCPAGGERPLRGARRSAGAGSADSRH